MHLRLAVLSIAVGLVVLGAAPGAQSLPTDASVSASPTNPPMQPGSDNKVAPTQKSQEQPASGGQTGAASASSPTEQPAASDSSLTPAKAEAPPVESVLCELESRFFVRTYSEDPVEQRLARLEQFVFGKRSSGSSGPRLAKLKSVLRPLQSIATTPKPSGSQAAPDVKSAAGTTTAGSASTDSSVPVSGAQQPAPPNGATPATAAGTTPVSSGEHFAWSHPAANSAQPDNANAASNSAALVKPKKEPGLIQVMNRGIDNYNLHRYHTAEDDFEQCCAMAPGMSRVYTYLAVTKLQIGERQSALDAFNTCYELDPFGAYGRYAKNCLLVLAGDEAIRKRGVVDSQKELDKALNKINQQSSDAIARHNKNGYDVSRLRVGIPYTSRNMFGYLTMDSQVQARLAQADAARRSAETAESANNLKHLLATKRMPGDANLRALGTNLTTRYYGSETINLAPYYIPREYPLQLRAIPRSINSVNSTTKKTAHAKASHGAPGAKPKSGRSAASGKHATKAKAKPAHRK